MATADFLNSVGFKMETSSPTNPLVNQLEEIRKQIISAGGRIAQINLFEQSGTARVISNFDTDVRIDYISQLGTASYRVAEEIWTGLQTFEQLK